MGSPAAARPRSISRSSPRRCSDGRQALVLVPEIGLTPQRWRASAPASDGGGVPFGPERRRATGHLAGGPRRPSTGGHRHPLRRVCALEKSWCHRGGRGARRLLQAAGWLPLFGARYRRGARPAPVHPHGAGIRHAFAGITAQRGSGALCASVTAGTRWRRPPSQHVAAGYPQPPAGRRSVRSAAGRHAPPSHGRWPGAAVPQPPRLCAHGHVP